MSAPDDFVKSESVAESDSEPSLEPGHAEAKNDDPPPTDACRTTPRTRRVFFSRSAGRDKSPTSSCDALHDSAKDSVTNQGRKIPPATHATVFQRFRGWSIRSGTSAQPLTPRLVTFVENGSKKKKEAGESDLENSHQMEHRDDSLGSSSSCTVPACNGTTPTSQESQFQTSVISSTLGDRSKDNGHSERDKGDGEEIKEDEEGVESPRSLWAASLIASTQARAQSTGRSSLGNCRNILPSPPRDPNKKVDYLILVCKAAKKYAWSQVGKLVKVRDGRHLFNQLLEVTSDLDRQRDKILAVYDTREVKNSADRLGETLKAVYELLGDLEDTSFMFGKKKGFGKRVSALVHDIGTNSNALLVATSLAIVDSLVAVLDRPNVLCTEGAGADEPQQEELVKMCIEGDKFFFGRGEKRNPRKAFEAYSWAGEQGFPEAMYMCAWMYRAGAHVEADAEKCRLWLEKAAEMEHPPAMNDLAVIVLDEADRLEEAHPGVKTSQGKSMFTVAPVDDDDHSDDENQGEIDPVDELDLPRIPSCSTKRDVRVTQDRRNSRGLRKPTDSAEIGEESARERSDERLQASLEEADIYEKIMDIRQRAMQLLLRAAKTGHTDAMTNLANMQEAMGFLEDARAWYTTAADPSESANNARAQNYLGTIFFEGRGVARDLDAAVKWFQRGARQGNVEACQNLGTCYEAGLGVPKDVPKAIDLFRRAVQGGSISASSKLAYLLARDALHTLAAVAPRYYSLDGVGFSFGETSRGLVQSGESNCCDNSKKVLSETCKAQLREAADLFRRAADNGIADASYQLGRLYQQGLGISHDPVAAFENFRAAADSPVVHPTAAACVGDMLYTGAGCARDRARAFNYYVRAANAGEAASANAVGLMFELGRGVERDVSAAGAWYAKAADLGALLVEDVNPLLPCPPLVGLGS